MQYRVNALRPPAAATPDGSLPLGCERDLSTHRHWHSEPLPLGRRRECLHSGGPTFSLLPGLLDGRCSSCVDPRKVLAPCSPWGSPSASDPAAWLQPPQARSLLPCACVCPLPSTTQPDTLLRLFKNLSLIYFLSLIVLHLPPSPYAPPQLLRPCSKACPRPHPIPRTMPGLHELSLLHPACVWV